MYVHIFLLQSINYNPFFSNGRTILQVFNKHKLNCKQITMYCFNKQKALNHWQIAVVYGTRNLSLSDAI